MVGFERLLVLVCICLPLRRLCAVLSGEWQRSMVMLGLSDAVCLSMTRFSLSSVLNFVVPLLLCSRTGLDIWVLTTLVCWSAAGSWLFVKASAFGQGRGSCCHGPAHDLGAEAGYGSGRSTTLRRMCSRAGLRDEDRLGNAETDAAADLGRRHQPELVRDVRATCSMLGIIGIPSYCSFIGSWLRCPGLLSTMMGGVAPPLICWFGIKGVGGSSVRPILGLTLILPLSLAAWFLKRVLGSVSWRLYHWCGCCCLAVQC